MTAPRLLANACVPSACIPDAGLPAGVADAVRVDILIERGVTVSVRPAASQTAPGIETVDCTDLIVLPGFVNAHYHSHDVLARGMFEHLPLESWGVVAFPQYLPPRSLEEVRARTLAGALECLKAGITTVQDMVMVPDYGPQVLETIVAAYDAIGIRCVMSAQLSDLPADATIPMLSEAARRGLSSLSRFSPVSVADQIAFTEAAAAIVAQSDKTTFALSPSAPQRCSHELLCEIARLAADLDVPVLTHLYETKAQRLLADREPGAGALDRLARAGLLNDRLACAHSVWLNDREIAQMGAAGAAVIHCPTSNLKLKSGVARLRECVGAGVGIALGCDNCSGSDVQSMLLAMRLACLLDAGRGREDGRPIDAAFAVEAATRGGARVLGLDGIGRIAPGHAADFVFFDANDEALRPLNSLLRQLVYSASERAIRHVMVGGRMVVEGGRLTTMKEDSLKHEAARLAECFCRDHADLVSKAKPLMGALRDDHAARLAAPCDLDRFIP